MTASDFYGAIANLINAKRNLCLYLSGKQAINTSFELIETALDNLCKEIKDEGCAAQVRQLAVDYGSDAIICAIATRL